MSGGLGILGTQEPSRTCERTVDLLTYARMQLPATRSPLDVVDERHRLAPSRGRALGRLSTQGTRQQPVEHGGVAKPLRSPQIGREPSPGSATGGHEQIHGDPSSYDLLLISSPRLLEDSLLELPVCEEFLGDGGALEREEELLPLSRPTHEALFLPGHGARSIASPRKRGALYPSRLGSRAWGQGMASRPELRCRSNSRMRGSG